MADAFSAPSLYSRAPASGAATDWPLRRERILEEIWRWDPDIVTLQVRVFVWVCGVLWVCVVISAGSVPMQAIEDTSSGLDFDRHACTHASRPYAYESNFDRDAHVQTPHSQEVDHYHDCLEPRMAALGYRGAFMRKPLNQDGKLDWLG